MRITNPKNISINETTITVNNKGYAPYIDFDSEPADIIVLAYQPGIGKSYNTIKYMEQQNNSNSFYLTNRHKAIKERVKGWKNKGLNHKHWEGFTLRCNDENKKKQAIQGILYSSLCKNCSDKKTCEYHKQFKAKYRILAPSSYLSTSRFIDKIKSMKTVIIDESISNIERVNINPKIVEKAFREIGVSPNYIHNIQIQNYNWFSSNIKTRMKHIWINYTKFLNNPKSDTKKIKGFNISEFEKFMEWYNIYFLHLPNRESFGIPLYYYAFNALNNQQNLKLVILDASFDKKLFQYFLEAYNGEKRFNKSINVQIYKTDETNKDTIIFKMRPNAWFPKSSLTTYIEESRNKIKESVREIRHIFGDENVGIITFKDIGKSKDIGDACNILDFNLEYYGGLRSSNKFVDTPVLVLIGTYFPPIIEIEKITGNLKTEGIIKDLDSYFLWKAPKNAVQEIKTRLGEIQDKKYRKQLTSMFLGKDKPRYIMPGRGCNDIIIGPQGKETINPVHTIVSRWKDEMYQAFHRNRGLQHNRIIFAYCWIPTDLLYEEKEKEIDKKIIQKSKIKNEFDVREIKNKEEKDLFKSLKLQLGDRYLVNLLMDRINEGKTDTKIAQDKKLKIMRKYDKQQKKGLITSAKLDKSRGPASNYIYVFKDGIYRRETDKIDARYSIKNFLKK